MISNGLPLDPQYTFSWPQRTYNAPLINLQSALNRSQMEISNRSLANHQITPNGPQMELRPSMESRRDPY